MPVLGLGVHVLVAVLFAIHAVRSGQDRYWLFILFIFPLLGSIVYAATIWIPEKRHGVAARRMARTVSSIIDPDAALRRARDALQDADTVETRLRYADALLDAGCAGEAAEQFSKAQRGIHRDDPDIEVRRARALLASGEAAAARDALEALIRKNPEYRSPDGHLAYAGALAALDEREAATHEFETLIGYFSGLEAHARYAETLREWGEHHRARVLCEQTLPRTRRLPAHVRQLNREWINRIRRVADTVGASV